jgi:hypothetical protein
MQESAPPPYSASGKENNREGIKSQVAVFGINGPISVAPSNFDWFREAATSTSSTTSTSSVLDGAVSRG